MATGAQVLDLGPAPLGWGEAKALVKAACRAQHSVLGIIKSNDKTHLAKNPFLKNALEEWVGEALARGSLAARAGEAGALQAVRGSDGHPAG